MAVFSYSGYSSPQLKLFLTPTFGTQSHYRWPGWIALCKKNGLVRSMSAKGCSPDSSAREGFFGRPENEFLYYDDWDEVPIEEFLKELDAYMHYYTEKREKESLGWLSPFQYRKSLGIAA